MRPLQLRHRVRSARWRVRWRRHGDLRAILNGLPALVGYWDADLHNRMANDAYVEFFGLTPRQMRGMHIRDVLGPELYAENAPYIAGALAGEPQLFDREIPTPSGQLRHTQASYVPDVVDGTVRGFFVLVTDITARREAEQARAVAEARFRALFESAPLGTFLSDAEGRILDVNPAGARLLGATREQLLSRTRTDLTHPDDVAASAERFERLIAGEVDSYRLEQRFLHAEGRVVWAQLDVTALRDDDGRLVALAQVQDISERKRAEVAIRRAKEEAERANSAKRNAVLTKPFEIEQLLTIVDGTGTGDIVRAPASAGAPEDEVVLDPARIANLRRIQPDAEVHELLDLFAEDSSASLERLASAARAADADAVARTSHAWKGACAVVGARRLVALLELVEAGACTGRVPDEQRIEAIEQGYSEVAAVIARELG